MVVCERSSFADIVRELTLGYCSIVSSKVASPSKEGFPEVGLSSRLVTLLKRLNQFCAKRPLTVLEPSTSLNSFALSKVKNTTERQNCSLPARRLTQ